MKKLLAGFVVCLFWTFQAQAAEPIIIPVVTDPSPVIDGNLQEWANRGVLRELNTPEQATFNRKGWKGLKDLSGWVRFGYDNQNLFVVCHVVDSFFLQDQSGSEAWRGDHVMLTLDFVRSGKIQDVMQFGLSPGSLKAPGAPGPDTKPELVIWEPANLSIAGAVVAARRTPEGYDLEAAIPWKVFRIKPVKFQTLAIQLAFSDCDTTPARQEKAISRDLLGFQVPFYLPLVKKSWISRGREISSHPPLFPGYVFLFGSEEERVRSLTTNRISRVLTIDDPDLLLHDLRQLRQLIVSKAPLTVESRLVPGNHVRVRHGPLAGLEGTVLTRRGETRLLVSINFIQKGASVEVDDFLLEPTD